MTRLNYSSVIAGHRSRAWRSTAETIGGFLPARRREKPRAGKTEPGRKGTPRLDTEPNNNKISVTKGCRTEARKFHLAELRRRRSTPLGVNDWACLWSVDSVERIRELPR